jgi:spore coat polysaccharide biosynthesis protein SpsF
VSVLCVVQARTGSSRLPGKVLADVDGRPMLRYMLDRLTGLAVDDLVVATSVLDRDQPVADVAADAGVQVLRGPEADVLARFAAALNAHPADTVVRLTADCPLVDPAVVTAVVELHHDAGADYTCNVLPRTFPKGLDVEVVAAPALRRAVVEATDPPEREHVTPYLYRHPEHFRLANLRSGEDLGDERWTVDTADDLEFVRTVAARFAGRGAFGWRDVLDAVGRTPIDPDVLRLRPAEAADSAALMAWRNDAETVRMSVSGRAVTQGEHDQWLAGRLRDPASRIWIAERGADALGSVRIDVTDAVGLVSIVVAPDARGAGVGTAMLELLQAELAGDFQVTALEAVVHPDNPRSLRVFERVGFRPTGRQGPFVVLRWATMEGEDR